MIGGGTHAELYRNKCGTYTETIGLRGGQKRNLRNLRYLITRECRVFSGNSEARTAKKHAFLNFDGCLGSACSALIAYETGIMSLPPLAKAIWSRLTFFAGGSAGGSAVLCGLEERNNEQPSI
jgi:hypothetical protein